MSGNRRSIRLKDYEYTQKGAYYVTVCVDDRACRGGSRAALNMGKNAFGNIKNGKMVLNEIGEIIHNSWLWLANQYDYVYLDEFIVMPNHMHGILFLTDLDVKGASRGAPTSCKPLGQLIGAFKTVSTKQINVI